MPNFFAKILLILLLVFTNSCITKAIWGNKSYVEEIGQFYVGNDGRYIVLIGPNYHYVFTDNSGMLTNIMSLEQRGILTINDKETYIKLEDDNSLSGYITFKGPYSVLPTTDMYKLQSLGIYPNKENDAVVKISVMGRRYVARDLGFKTPTASNFIRVRYKKDTSLFGGVGKAAITPVAVTLDAVLLIGKVAMIPFRNY